MRRARPSTKSAADRTTMDPDGTNHGETSALWRPKTTGMQPIKSASYLELVSELSASRPRRRRDAAAYPRRRRGFVGDIIRAANAQPLAVGCVAAGLQAKRRGAVRGLGAAERGRVVPRGRVHDFAIRRVDALRRRGAPRARVRVRLVARDVTVEDGPKRPRPERVRPRRPRRLGDGPVETRRVGRRHEVRERGIVGLGVGRDGRGDVDVVVPRGARAGCDRIESASLAAP